MRHRVDARLLTEARTFALRFACEDCAHHDAERDACVHGYPERPRSKEIAAASATVAFCKEFELGGGVEGVSGVEGAVGVEVGVEGAVEGAVGVEGQGGGRARAGVPA